MSRLTRFVSTILLLCSAAVSLNAQSPHGGGVVTLDDSVLLQSTPIFVGEDSFTARIETIKAEGREPLGLVLSGGSARAYAHIGVLREFEKHDAKPDFIVANSMGAIIGMLYSAGFAPDDIAYIVEHVDLNSFFDLVFPSKGGLLSQRYFQEALSRLFPDRYFNLKDSYIPIIIPAEDLVTKRCIWFAEGDYVSIMTAAFAMSAMMEPVEYTLPDGNQTLLVDAGVVDLGCISIAERFSHNLIISTAFYTAPMNLYNPIVILNRTMSIGKERKMIGDILDAGYPYIRNPVENFSFMDFSNVSTLIAVGDDCAADFFATHDTSAWPTWSSYRQKHPEVYSKLRTQRYQAARQFVSDIQHGLEPYSREFYANLKIRPNIAAIDTPDLYFSNPISAGIYGLADYRMVKARAGIYADFDSYGADAWIRLHTQNGFESLTVASADLNYAGGPVVWYGAQQLSWKIPLSTSASLTPFAAVEAGSELLFSHAGITFNAHNEAKTLDFSLSPSGFILQDIHSAGIGVKTGFNCYALPVIGFSVHDTFRWNQNGNGITCFAADGFRGAPAATDTKFTASGSDTWISISNADLFLHAPSSTLTAMEMFKLEKIRAGAYFDAAITGNTMQLAAGVDTCAQISFLGLTNLNLNAYTGWDFENKSLCSGISIVSRF